MLPSNRVLHFHSRNMQLFLWSFISIKNETLNIHAVALFFFLTLNSNVSHSQTTYIQNICNSQQPFALALVLILNFSLCSCSFSVVTYFIKLTWICSSASHKQSHNKSSSCVSSLKPKILLPDSLSMSLCLHSTANPKRP